jgi:hypothetical protein
VSINPKVINSKISQIVNKYTLLLRYMMLGPKALTKKQIKLLIKEKMLSPKFYRPTIDDAYLETHLKNLKLVSPKSIRDYTIKHLRESAGQLIDNFTTKISTDISNIVNNNLLSYSQKLREIVPETLADAMLKKRTVKQIIQELKDKTEDHFKDWERITVTEIARANNLGATDAIIANNPDKDFKEIYVYKVGPDDGKKCKFCHKFWQLPDGTPRVYKLSELMANGTNYGKKQVDWQATIEPTHPRCREILLELPLGYGFKAGKLTYISKEHSEYKFQNA